MKLIRLIGKSDRLSDHGIAIAGNETQTAEIGEVVVARTHGRSMRFVVRLRNRTGQIFLRAIEFNLNASSGFFVSQVPLA